jgi:hypothetical protein
MGFHALPRRETYRALALKQESSIIGRVYDEKESRKDCEKLKHLGLKMAAHLWGIFEKRGIKEIY